MLLFYTDEIDGQRAVFSGQEAVHIGKVLRMKSGDRLQWTDGKGMMYSGALLSVGKREAVAVVERTTPWQKTWKRDIHIAVCPTKNIQRTEWMIEKLCEMGVDSITPVIAQNSERRTVKTEKLRRKIISACTQSLKGQFPTLHEPLPLQAYLSAQRDTSDAFIAHCRGTLPPLARKPLSGDTLHILIGPEGDFTTQEIKDAVERGWQPVGLGLSRLRTETAALVACQTFHIIETIGR